MAQDPHRLHSSKPSELKALNAMALAGKAFVAWRDQDDALQLLELDPTVLRMTIGRAGSSAIALDWDPEVSSLHAELVPIDTAWVIADDGLSVNGTFVGGERVGSRRRLRDEDRIVVGETTLVFHAGRVDASETLRAGGKVVQRADLNASDLLVLRSLAAPLLLDGAAEPATNEAIAGEACLTVWGVKRCLTRLYKRFEITEDPKRRRLAQRAIAAGIVSPGDFVR